MLQAIETKQSADYTSIKVKAQCGAVNFKWDDSLNIEDNHRAAAERYAINMSWFGAWYGGWSADGHCGIFVRASVELPADACETTPDFTVSREALGARGGQR